MTYKNRWPHLTTRLTTANPVTPRGCTSTCKNRSSTQPGVNWQSTVTFTTSKYERKASWVHFWEIFDRKDSKRAIFYDIIHAQKLSIYNTHRRDWSHIPVAHNAHRVIKFTHKGWYLLEVKTRSRQWQTITWLQFHIPALHLHIDYIPYTPRVRSLLNLCCEPIAVWRRRRRRRRRRRVIVLIMWDTHNQNCQAHTTGCKMGHVSRFKISPIALSSKIGSILFSFLVQLMCVCLAHAFNILQFLVHTHHCKETAAFTIHPVTLTAYY